VGDLIHKMGVAAEGPTESISWFPNYRDGDDGYLAGGVCGDDDGEGAKRELIQSMTSLQKLIKNGHVKSNSNNQYSLAVIFRFWES